MSEIIFIFEAYVKNQGSMFDNKVAYLSEYANLFACGRTYLKQMRGTNEAFITLLRSNVYMFGKHVIIEA
jgi:hypothetical protein